MSNEAVARHLANRAELLAARDAVKARWAAEDEGIAAARAEHMAKFDQGLADADAVIVAAGGEVPVEVVPAEEPVGEHHDDEHAA